MKYFTESDRINGIICYELCIISFVTDLFSRPEKSGLQIMEFLIQETWMEKFHMWISVLWLMTEN